MRKTDLTAELVGSASLGASMGRRVELTAALVIPATPGFAPPLPSGARPYLRIDESKMYVGPAEGRDRDVVPNRGE